MNLFAIALFAVVQSGAVSVPADTVYVLGSATGAGALIEFSHDGGISFDATESAPITHLRWTLAAPLAPGDSGTATFRAVVR